MSKTPLQRLDEEVQQFWADYFGKRENETLGQAMERVAMEENPMLAFRKVSGNDR